jgi:N-acetylglutamate synthase-like GNAT family acetyltransferase
VAREGGALVGAIALEVCRRRGLVRSLVVASAHRGTGLAKDLLSRVVSRSHELGLRDLYLLTESAAGFFAKRGFGEISRDAVPEEIRQTREFREQCLETATVMCMPLETRW